MRKLYGLAETLELLGGMSRSEAYREMAAGRLRYIQRGRRRLFEASAIEDYIESLKTSPSVEQLVELIDETGRIDVDRIPRGTSLADLENAKRIVAQRKAAA